MSLLFALIYFYNEIWCRNNIEFAKKINFLDKNVTVKELDKIPEHNLLYYIWFSLITQTTVGYANMLPNTINSNNEKEIFKASKMINMAQLISIFIVAGYL